MLLGVGAVATKTYVDDIFSTFLYTGTGSARSINNGIDQSGEGSLTWIKDRDDGNEHMLFDTARGATKYIMSDASSGEATATNGLTSFNNNGFTVGDWNWVNENNHDYASWTFRKAPGFFDIQEYSSGSSNTSGSIGNANFQVNHDLGCIPGMILIKRTNSTNDWFAWVRGKEGVLNSTNELDDASALPLANVTSTYFKFSAGNGSYNDPGNFIAYIFAGGESDAATARSVDMDGSGDYLSLASSSDFAPGTGDFTLECWLKPDNWSNTYVELYGIQASTGLRLIKNSGNIAVAFYGSSPVLSTSQFPEIGQWTHVAVTRSGTNLSLFYNGIKIKTVTNSTNATGQGPLLIGNESGGGAEFDGKISNVRFVKGTAVYTSSFKPPTEPLTNITNTKLLCCNNSSTTGSTVTPGTITANGDPTASSDSPFDDPAGFVFGDAGDQNVIKCGSYVGNGSSTGPEIYLGWEPSWLLIKNATGSNREWKMLDAMRGLPMGTGDATLIANTNEAETDNHNVIDLTSTGFKITDNNAHYNENGETIIYCAIRRPDGYVGKKYGAGEGTSVFTMVTGVALANGNPNYISNGVRDFGIFRKPATTENWNNFTRLTQGTNIFLNTTGAESSLSVHQADFNNGMVNATASDVANYQSWMWKRHAGFDVVTYKGDGVAGRQIPHSLNKTVEMIWVKDRSSSNGWAVGHRGLDGGTNPWEHNLKLNESAAEESYTNRWNDTAPTSTHFTVGTSNRVNTDGDDYLALLFSSIDGISKVGSYSGSNSDQTITLGFQPRFFLCKSYNTQGTGVSWNVFDSVRGISGSSTKRIFLNTDGVQQTGSYVTSVSSTGITLAGDFSHSNQASRNYIYYAHA